MNSDTFSEDLVDDEVVCEMDVFLSEALSGSLYLFHYPSRTNATSVDDNMNCLSARIKPKQQKVEMELEINVHSENYDRDRGEQIAYNVDGQNSSGPSHFNSSFMDKNLLFGVKACSTVSYAVGLVKQGEIHITPVHSCIEMRPGFTHMDKIDSASKKAQNAGGEDEPAEAEIEAVPLTMKFEGPNAERDRQIREKSYQYLQQQNANEPWINVNYHKLGSNRSIAESEKFICSQTHRDTSCDSVPPQDYLKELVPESLRLSGYQTVVDVDLAVLSNKPLSDQIRHLMTNAHVLPFSTILKKLPWGIDIVSVERLVQQIAVLVQGCWAVKSELLYDENSVSPLSGLNSKLLINARDYIIWLFTKSKFLIRKEILSLIHVPNEDFESIILPMAIRTNRGWEFKYPYDKEFVESHPSIQQSQEIKWNLRYKKLVKDLGMCESEGVSPKNSYSVPSRPKQKRHSRSSVSEGDESGNDSGTSGTKDTKTKHNQIPKKRAAPSPTKHSAKTKPFQIATLDISPTFLETSPPENIKAELKEYVGDVIRTQFCMTLAEIKDLVAESHLSFVVNRGDFQKLLEDALVDAGAEKLKNKWPQNTTPETLYAFAKYGNKLDRYRVALLDLFSTTARARTNLFVKKVEDELRELVSDADCRQIFEEYCIYKSGFYYLKGTIALDRMTNDALL